MEQTLDSFDDVAIRKDLSYLCILVVLILHILFLLLFFTFTQLIKQMPMQPSFDTEFDVSAPPGSGQASSSSTGISDDDTAPPASAFGGEEGKTADKSPESAAPETITSAQAASADQSVETTIVPEGSPLPDVIDQVFRSEHAITQPTTPPTAIPKRKPSGRAGTYRVRKMHYDTNFSINGTTFAQMGHQVHNNITQTRATEAKEKKAKELKYQSYVNGLHKFLYGNFNPRNESINLEYSVYMPIDVDIEIDKTGSCKNISMSNSTGDRDLDSFIIYHLKKAGPFPPLPNYFGLDSWHFQLRLMVNCQRGKGIPKITPH